MSDYVPDQEDHSIGCMVLIMGFFFTFAAGVAVGHLFW